MGERRVLAVDIGAESGRAVVGSLSGDSLTLRETLRFANEPVSVGERLHWNPLSLLGAVRAAIADSGPLDSVGIDTWGLDFALVDPAGELLTIPRHYRDPWTQSAVASVSRALPGTDLYGATGIQTLRINTLYQLWALREQSPAVVDAAARLLLVPDLLGFWLTGVLSSELTIASTTQLVAAGTRDWAWQLIDDLGFDRRLFSDLTSPGTVIGEIRDGDPHPAYVATASHDTASAVAGAVGVRNDTAFISTGTWCLVGAEVDGAVINDTSRAADLSNELAPEGRTRLLKNVMGLWLIAESRRHWQRTGVSLSYDKLVASAAAERPLTMVFDPDAPSLLEPGDIPLRISRMCGSESELDPPIVTRAIIDSLALKFRLVLEQLEAATGRTFLRINLVGGGARNELLCQTTANASGRMVIAGPSEATALGNVLVQLIAHGDVASVDEGRQLAARTADLREYEPTDTAAWQSAYQRFVTRIHRTPP